MNLNQLTLVSKTKEELLAIIEDEASVAYNGGDDLHIALENIEQVVYVLKNCDYEGKE